MSKDIRNPYVLPMILRNKSAKFNKKINRGGSKNEMLDYLEEYEMERTR
jgi:hypothetical protein